MRAFTLICLILLSSCLAPLNVSAEHADAEQQVRALVQSFFDVIASKDVEAARKLVLSDASGFAIIPDGASRRLQNFTFGQWLERLPSGRGEMYEAFLEEPTVLIDDDLAVVWGRYEFLLDGERSHTGIDAFLVARTDDGWRMAGALFSVVR